MDRRGCHVRLYAWRDNGALALAISDGTRIEELARRVLAPAATIN